MQTVEQWLAAGNKIKQLPSGYREKYGIYSDEPYNKALRQAMKDTSCSSLAKRTPFNTEEIRDMAQGHILLSKEDYETYFKAKIPKPRLDDWRCEI